MDKIENELPIRRFIVVHRFRYLKYMLKKWLWSKFIIYRINMENIYAPIKQELIDIYVFLQSE